MCCRSWSSISFLLLRIPTGVSYHLPFRKMFPLQKNVAHPIILIRNVALHKAKQDSRGRRGREGGTLNHDTGGERASRAIRSEGSWRLVGGSEQRHGKPKAGAASVRSVGSRVKCRSTSRKDKPSNRGKCGPCSGTNNTITAMQVRRHAPPFVSLTLPCSPLPLLHGGPALVRHVDIAHSA